MADVLTSRLRMTKPDIGGSDDTWGSKLNTDMDIVDRVYQDLSGALVSATFGSTNAHEVTLTHSSYSDIDSTLGFRLIIRSGATNTAAMTLDVGDGNGPRQVRKALDGNSLKQLDAGDFPLDYVGDFVYIRRSGFSGWMLLNPATGVVSPPPAATETVVGVSRFATNLEAQAGTLGTVAVTPKNLKVLGGSIVPPATTTVAGIVELATNAEAIAGTDAARAVTPAALLAAVNSFVPIATSAKAGVVELATDAEALTGTDTQRVLTAKNLDYVFDARAATTAVKGTVLLAVGSEALAGTDAAKALTAVALEYAFDNRVASSTVKGPVTFATDAEALTGTNVTKAINPESLDYVLDARITTLREEFDARIVAVLKQYALIPE